MVCILCFPLQIRCYLRCIFIFCQFCKLYLWETHLKKFIIHFPPHVEDPFLWLGSTSAVCLNSLPSLPGNGPQPVCFVVDPLCCGNTQRGLAGPFLTIPPPWGGGLSSLPAGKKLLADPFPHPPIGSGLAHAKFPCKKIVQTTQKRWKNRRLRRQSWLFPFTHFSYAFTF